jgi:hypothetical protein
MVNKWTADRSVVATQGHLASRVGGQLVILGVTSGRYYGLNAVGARVWELIQEERSVGALQAALLSEFDVAPERLALDIAALLDSFVCEGLAREGARLAASP